MSSIPEHRIERRNVAELTPADYNPRTITDRALGGLRASVERFGLVQPIIVNERTGNVVGGHQRLKVLLDLGTAQVDVVVVDLPKTEEKALNVALNSPAISGDFSDGLDWLVADIAGEDSEIAAVLLFDDLVHGSPVEAAQAEGMGGDGLHGVGATEIDPGKFSNFEHTCPRCDFEFND